MPAKMSHLKAELAALQAERAVIDLQALTQTRDEKRAAKVAYTPPLAQFSDQHERALNEAAGAAENALSSAQFQAAALDRPIHRLQAMLTAPARVTQAQVTADALAEQAALAGAKVAEAQSTLESLQGLLADASATHALERDAAAREVLASAKAGRARSAGGPDRSAVEALESALTMARAELAEAQAAHAQATQAHRDALGQLRSAQGDAARAVYELVLRDFAEAVAHFRKMTTRDYSPGEDLHRLVLKAERAAAAA